MPRTGSCVERGTMNKRVAVQSVTETRDAAGGVSQSWSTDRTVWASVVPLSGREYYQAQQAQSQVTHKVSMLYFAGLTSKQRLLFGTRVFEIAAVININESNELYELMCVEATT